MTLSAADRMALADVVHGYAAAVDDRRFDDAAELFTDTAQLKLPDPPQILGPILIHEGRHDIRSAIAAVAAVPRTEHEIVGEVFRSDSEDAASGRITCIAHHWSQRARAVNTTGGGPEYTDVVWHARYDDQYVRTDDGWRIQVRTLTINAIETRPIRRLR